jgi:hypothetical protein
MRTPLRRAVGTSQRRRARTWLVIASLAILGGLAASALSLATVSGHVLRWVEEHWLNTVAVTAGATVLAAVTPFVTRLMDRGHDDQAGSLAARGRALMLRRVRYKWITGVLEPSLSRAPQLTLSLQRRTDVLHRVSLDGQRHQRPGAVLPRGKTVTAVFDEVGGGLLVLGAPGAGKTTVLLQLADELLDRAERDPEQPIPVVVNLASWTARPQPLIAWLTGELTASYKVPQRTAATWIAQGSLVLLLDGLDEIAESHRPGCAEAINDYRRDHGLVPIAVCATTGHVEGMPVRLDLDEAVELLPPTDADVDGFLDGLQEAGGTSLAELRAVLARDAGLRNLLRSPLMLNVVACAYDQRPAPTPGQSGASGDRLGWLWDAYIERMFQQWPLGQRCRYTQRQATEWLAWLARSLRDRDQAEFHLDRITAGWLPPGRHGKQRSSRASRTLRAIAEKNHQAERLRWRPLGRHDHLSLALAGTSCALLLLGILAWHDTKLDVPLLGAGVFNLFGLLGKNVHVELRDERDAPNVGVRWSGRNALASGLVVTLVYGLAGWLQGGAGEALTTAPALGAFAAAGFGGWGFIQHYAVRALLAREGSAPLRYGSFLQAMTRRHLLYRAGSAYIFMHRLLRDHLAGQPARAQAHGKPAATQ